MPPRSARASGRVAEPVGAHEAETAAPTVRGADRVSATLDDLRERGIHVPDRRAVLAFLRAHAELLPVVARVSGVAVDRLGDRCELSLEVYRDPEIWSKRLFLYARQSPDDPDLLSTIDAITLEHWRLPANATGWFQLTTDFQPPRRR